MSLREIEDIEAVMRHDPHRYHGDAAMQKKYRDLLAETPQYRMSKSELHRAANSHEAEDKVASVTPIGPMSDDELLAHREQQLRHRDHGAAYRRLIADNDERGT